MSGLDELTRGELIALVLTLHETVQAQKERIAELEAIVQRQAERIAELEEEVRRLRGGKSSAPLWIRPSVQKKEKSPRRKRTSSFARKNLAPTRVIYQLWGVKISAGEIAEILHDVAEVGQSEYDALLSRIRGSPVLHGDETGWREDGVNGYLWSFSSPEVRYTTCIASLVQARS